MVSVVGTGLVLPFDVEPYGPGDSEFNASRRLLRRAVHNLGHRVFSRGRDRVEVWDADDFDPWEALRWRTVRVIFYRQHQPDGRVIEAFWLTDFPSRRVGSREIFRLAKSRWGIENQGFNDAKNRYGFEHVCHHESHSLLIVWLLTCLALILERLYRLRYLHRGTHPVRTAIDLLRHLQLTLSAPSVAESS